MKRNKRVFYSREFKERVLKVYEEVGPKAACEEFGVHKSLLMAWRRNLGTEKFSSGSKSKPTTIAEDVPTSKRKKYSKEFKEEVLEYFIEHGEGATVSKFEVNSNLIYSWRKAKTEGRLRDSVRVKNQNEQNPLSLLEKVDPFKKYSDAQKKEVLIFYGDNGKEETMRKYGITAHRLSNWRKKLKIDKFPQSNRLSKEENEFRREVLDLANTKGIKAASVKFSVTIPVIWDWRSKMKKETGKTLIKEAKKRNVYNRDHREEIVEFYLKNGAAACEKKFQVPRQTVRNWSLQNGGVTFTGRDTVDRKKIVQCAMEEGVKSTAEKYSVSRATLYNWSKLPDVNVTEGPIKDTIAVEVKKSGKVRRVVFFKKKPAKVKVPKEKKPKVLKSKVKSKRAVPKNSTELPEWAKDFIKKKVPTVEKSLVVSKDETFFSSELFSLSAGSFLFEDQSEPGSSPVKVKSDEQTGESDEDECYECDFVAKELFELFPFSSV